MTLHHQHPHPAPTRNSMLTIYQLLLIQCRPNFKGSFPGSSLTIDNCQSGICTVNIWSGKICPYFIKLLNYWQNLNIQTFKARFLWPTLTGPSCPDHIGPGNICQGNICPIFRPQNFWSKNLGPKYSFGPEIILEA